MKIPDWLPVFGDMSYRGECPSENEEQVTFFNHIRIRFPYTLGRLALHPRNEGKRNWKEAQREKLDGMATGASDIVIPGNPTFLCELKRQDHTQSRLSEPERQYLLEACKHGAFVCVALGWDGAMEAVEEWMK